jgi:predicted metalloprotease with PDZ domain
MARGELKTIKFQMMLSESEAKTLDAWAEKHGFKSRAEVIRRLVQLALLTDEQANRVAKNLNILDNLSVRFIKRVRELHTSFRSSKVRLAERLANLAERYSEDFFDYVGDLALDLDLVLGATKATRSNQSLDDVVEQLRKDRERIEETSEAWNAARQKRREERRRLEGVDFLDLQSRMEAIIKSSPDLDTAQQAAQDELALWLDAAKTKKQEIRKLEQEREVYLAERRKHREEQPVREPDSEDDQGQT